MKDERQNPFKPKRRRFPFEGTDNWFREFDEMFEQLVQRSNEDFPRPFETEEESERTATEPRRRLVYGYSMRVGLDGKPVIHEFGNMKPRSRKIQNKFQQPPNEAEDTREPLLDFIDEPEKVRIVAELPGVDKTQIKIETVNETLLVNAETASPKYHEEIPLPQGLDVNNAKATYNNGVLEIIIAKKKLAPMMHKKNTPNISRPKPDRTHQHEDSTK
jgi:HSP20 family protein